MIIEWNQARPMIVVIIAFICNSNRTIFRVNVNMSHLNNGDNLISRQNSETL